MAVSAALALALGATVAALAAAAGRLGEAAWLATVIGGAMAAYLGGHAALGSDEVRLAWSALTRPARRRSSLRRRETR